MNEATERFVFSEETIRRRRKLLIAVGAGLIPGVMVPFVMEVPAANRMEALLICFASAALFALIFVVESWWMFRQLRAMSLEVLGACVVRHSASASEQIPWSEITSVTKRLNPRGVIRSIEVCKASGRPVTLWGFEPMAKLADLIDARLPETVRRKIKRSRVNFESPLVMFLYCLAIGCALFVLRRSTGQALYENLNLLFMLFVGVAFPMYGPLSRSNPSFRKYELILGTILAACALAMLLMH